MIINDAYNINTYVASTAWFSRDELGELSKKRMLFGICQQKNADV